ncbi:MAG TPA: Wzz/FepE/Etk N-terminal domain-containing protein [Gemmatimonadaceae bacterium]|nr:Wzz/FepE/Etk N-terminal domain-containing protein [Gemmatimonadaceae bacterium]
MSATTAADTIDLADVGRALRRGWQAIVLFVVLGALAAVAVIVFAPPKFGGEASLVLKTGGDAGASVLSRLSGGLSDAGGMLSGALKSPIETEIAILDSRAVAGRVVDSLLLQARVVEPRGTPTNRLVASYALAPSFAPRKYTFTRAGDGSYLAVTKGDSAKLMPGVPGKLAIGQVTLMPGVTAPSLQLEFRDHEDAIARLTKHLSIDKAGGEVAKIGYQGDDSISAAAVPNALVAIYLARRTTTDRGVNQHRVEFLEAKADSASRELAAAEQALRRQQEASGVIDPQVVGKLELERAVQLRGALTEIRVEDGAIKQLMQQVKSGTIRPRDLGAYPAFLKSAGVNELLSQLTQVETDRYKLLESRTEKDPEVIALTQSSKSLEGQMVAMAQTYATSLERQEADYQTELDGLTQKIAGLPAVSQSGLRLQRDVLRLGTIYAGIQAQLVGARLAAIEEGGDVRALDVATVPRKPAFPDPVKTAGFGIGGGLGAGLVAALLLGLLGRWMQDPRQVEQTTGFPALRFDSAIPLFIGTDTAQTILVLPIDPRARAEPVARQIAQTALARSMSATVLDLSSLDVAAQPLRLSATSNGNTNGGNGAIDVNASIERLEQEHSLVVVQLPSLGSAATIAALRRSRPVVLVVPERRIDRAELMGAVQTLKRLDMPCAGIVLSGNANGALAN